MKERQESMDKLEKLKEILKENIEKILKDNKKMSLEIAKREIKSVLNDIMPDENIDKNIHVERNKKDKNVINVHVYGEIAKLIENKLIAESLDKAICPDPCEHEFFGDYCKSSKKVELVNWKCKKCGLVITDNDVTTILNRFADIENWLND